MTGIVLALAGLACGDGGPGTGAATAPVAGSFSGRWVGTVRLNGGQPLRARWDNTACLLEIKGFAKGAAHFAAQAPGVVRVDIPGEGTLLGTYGFEAGHLGLRLKDDKYGDTFLFVLRPAATRKP